MKTKIENTIEIKEETRIPGTDIVLEAGDKILVEVKKELRENYGNDEEIVIKAEKDMMYGGQTFRLFDGASSPSFTLTLEKDLSFEMLDSLKEVIRLKFEEYSRYGK